MNKNKLVYGWGINDVDFPVQKYEVIGAKKKRVWACAYYVKWKDMLRRCFSNKFQERSPTYKGCTISEDWKYLSNFIKWVDSQPNKDWEKCNLDKDFLSVGIKHYGPETVVFIPTNINVFITDRGNSRGEYMIGVSYYADKNKKKPYIAQCCNPFTRKQEYLGYYSTELEAHLVWRSKKHEHACKLADLQEDGRIAKRLREMYTTNH